MRKDRNPTRNRVYRNVFCSDYNHCLDYAISESWNSWNCNRCKLRFDQALEMEMPFALSQTIANHEYSVRSINWD